MVAMNMMQMTIYQIVYMITVRDGQMTTARSVDMARFVTTTAMIGCAGVRVGIRYRYGVLIIVTIMWMMKVSIVQIINMSVMNDGLVATTRPVDVVVRSVGFAISHWFVPLMPHLKRSSSTWSKVLVSKSRT